MDGIKKMLTVQFKHKYEKEEKLDDKMLDEM